MKNICLTLFFCFMLFRAYSQEKPITGVLVDRFISYYNASQSDSLYTLFSDEIKQKMPLNGLVAALQQLKPLGNLLKSEYIGSEKGIATYISTFEKSNLVLNLHFDQKAKIAGFYVNADSREKATVKEKGEPVSINTNGAILKGTLSVPSNSQKVPVVLLITGSGPTDRNGNTALMSGKPNYLLKLSEALTANNIAVLRYDKRGVGQSSTTKTEAETTFEDMVDDALALVNFLKNDSRFSKVIIVGHSEGSLIGMLASRRGKADGFISLAGAGLSIDHVLKTQFKEALTAKDYNKAIGILDSIKSGKQIKQPLTPILESTFRKSVRPYLNSWMKYNPKTELAKLNIPILIIQGTHDIQVSVQNAQQLKQAKPNAQLVLIDGMSHILKEAPEDRAQNIASYSNDSLDLHPKLVPALTDFINKIK